ncbi:MAG: hypothetical protein ACTSXV_00670 [Alphaproteobacteria bacterium]
MKRSILFWMLVLVSIAGCVETTKQEYCNKNTFSPQGCRAKRTGVDTTIFLATTLYQKSGQQRILSSTALDEVVRFQKLYHADINLISHSLDESKSLQVQRLKTLVSYLQSKGVPFTKISQKIENRPLYRNGKKHKNLSRRIEIYLEY